MNKNKIYWFVFSLLLLLLIVIQYYGLVRYRYPVPPGHDAMILWHNIVLFQKGLTDFWSYFLNNNYPPMFFASTAFLARYFGNDAMKAMLWLTPSILIFSSLSIFTFVYKSFNKYAALIVFTVYAFATKNPIQQLNDGGYPNLIASQIILPLSFLLLYLSVQNKGKKRLVYISLSLASIFLIFLYHHLTTIYIIALLIISPIILMIYFWKENSWKIAKGVTTLVSMLAFCSAAIYLFLTNQFFNATRAITNSVFSITPGFPYLKLLNNADPEALVPLRNIPSYAGQGLILFGLMGLITFLIGKLKLEKITYGVLAIYSLMLIFGSRLSFLTNPDRLIRDLAFPLSVFAGLFLYYSIQEIFRRNKKLLLLFLSLVCLIFVYSILPRVKGAFRYEPMVRTTSADMEIIGYLKNQNPQKIFVESYNFYLSYLLPDWQIDYLWNPFTDQSNVTIPNPEEPSSKLENYDYVYLTESQSGWLPQGVVINRGTKYQNNPSDFELVKDVLGPTNQLKLFKVKK